MGLASFLLSQGGFSLLLLSQEKRRPQGPEPPLSALRSKARYSLFYRGFELISPLILPVLCSPGVLFLLRTVPPWAHSRGNVRNVRKRRNPLLYTFDQRKRALPIPHILVQRCFLWRGCWPFLPCSPLGLGYFLRCFYNGQDGLF